MLLRQRDLRQRAHKLGYGGLVEAAAAAFAVAATAAVSAALGVRETGPRWPGQAQAPGKELHTGAAEPQAYENHHHWDYHPRAGSCVGVVLRDVWLGGREGLLKGSRGRCCWRCKGWDTIARE